MTAGGDEVVLMTPGEAARALRVSPDTVRVWAREGLLPCIRIGPAGHRRFRRDDVQALVTARSEGMS